MKKSIKLLFALFFICYQSCTNDTSEKEIEYQLPATFLSTNKIRYNVEGGGEIDFIVENEPDSISIIVLSYQFQSREDSLMMSKQEIDSIDLVIIEEMFRGVINIGGVIYQKDLLLGSWTYLYIEYSNDWLRVANEAIIKELSSFYNLVCEKIDVHWNTLQGFQSDSVNLSEPYWHPSMAVLKSVKSRTIGRRVGSLLSFGLISSNFTIIQL